MTHFALTPEAKEKLYDLLVTVLAFTASFGLREFVIEVMEQCFGERSKLLFSFLVVILSVLAIVWLVNNHTWLVTPKSG
jgi:hypothetical protein